MNAYYNTNGLVGDSLRQAQKKAISQEEEVLSVFKAINKPLAPHEVQDYSYNLRQAPLTSIRRAMTNLVKSGKLIRCDDMVDGTFGKPVHQWRLVG